jgi:hypothetical protein
MPFALSVQVTKSVKLHPSERFFSYRKTTPVDGGIENGYLIKRLRGFATNGFVAKARIRRERRKGASEQRRSDGIKFAS